MTNVERPPSIEERLSRLENLFANIGETVAAHDSTIDVLVANIQQLTENVNAVNQRVDSLAQQAAIDRQSFQAEIRQIWQYLRDRNGGSSTPS
jgi:uncharacterized protein YoxC